MSISQDSIVARSRCNEEFATDSPQKQTSQKRECMSSSLIGRSGSSAFRLSSTQCHSRARASLRNRHQGPSIMGFEDEAERSFGRSCRQADGRSKRTYELTSSIVPRGTPFHRLVELAFSPIGFNVA